MKTSLIRFSLVTFCVLLLAGCSGIGILRGSGNVVRELREVDSFTGISICCGMHLVLQQGEPVQVEIEGDDNFLTEIESLVVGSELRVQYRPSTRLMLNRFSSQPITVYITAPTIETIVLSGGSQLAAEALTADTLAFSLSGGSQGEVGSLVVTTVEVELSGGSHLNLTEGTADEQSVDASGGSNYNAKDLASASADLDLSGGSHARIWVSESLTVDSSGGSDLAYYGSPEIDQDVSGGSKINGLGEH